jgi:antitoxin (DNA-binding transcriptional repressor) of toxin-antitoxin stability system
MRYVTVRELNTKPKEVWEKLKESDLVVTSNGKPIAILSGADEASLEERLRALRRSRALMAMEEMQKTAAVRGLDRWPERRIADEIKAARKARRA